MYLKGGGVWIQNCLRTDISVKIAKNEWKKLNADQFYIVQVYDYHIMFGISFSCGLSTIFIRNNTFLLFPYSFFYVIDDKNMFLKQFLSVLNCVHNKETGIPIVQL